MSLLVLLQRGVGLWLRSPSHVRGVCEALLSDALLLAAAEQQQQQEGLVLTAAGSTATLASLGSTVSPGSVQLQQGAAAPTATAGRPSAADMVALWAAVTNKKGLMIAAFKAQGNTRVG